MTPAPLLLILSIHALALVAPGPDFAVVTRTAIVSGRRAGLWARLVWLDRTVGAVLLVLAAKVSVLAMR